MTEKHANKIRDEARPALFERARALDWSAQHERPMHAQTMQEPHAPCGRCQSIRGRRLRNRRRILNGRPLPTDSAAGGEA
jgi:hypothetical protein